MTQGIFQKIFALFQEACHELDLKLMMYWRENTINSSEYERYCSMLRDLSSATRGGDNPTGDPLLARGLLELSSTCHTNVKVLVRESGSY